MTDHLYQSRILAAFDAVTLTRGDQFLWLGRNLPESKPHLIHSGSEQRRFDIVARLTPTLYDGFYCSGGALSVEPESRELSDRSSVEFVEKLINANSGQGFDEEGWQIRSRQHGRIVARRDGLTVTTNLDASKTVAMEIGTTISLRQQKGNLSLSPGYYFAFGDAGVSGANPQIRLYWNTTSEAGIELTRRVTKSLNKSHTPFGLKVLTSLTGHRRRVDSAVLYLARHDYFAVAHVLLGIYKKLQPELKSLCPAFTKMLAPGVGLAESPTDGMSFGHHRSALLAAAIVHAHERNGKSRRLRWAGYEEVFRRNNLDPDHPYLNSGSEDSYAVWQETHTTRSRAAVRSKTPKARNALDISMILGQRLCQEALWWEDRCTWLTIETDLDSDPEAASAFSWSTLDPSLYSGTAGVGFFLAQLAGETGEPTLRKTAEGAMRQSIAALEQVPVELRFGYYSGWAGIIASLFDTAQILNSHELCIAGRKIVEQLSRHDSSDAHTEMDLLTGKAGTITAIVTRSELSGDPKLISFANRLAGEIIRDAMPFDSGVGWPVASSPGVLPLAGLSHGASGIALALLELDRVAPNRKVKLTADKAFAYERWLFDPTRSNWPDLRGQKRRRRKWHDANFLTAWCHGAPGIALARARAYMLYPDPVLLSELETARATTRESILTDLRDGTQNCALCHGLLGNAEVLSLCSRIMCEAEDPLVDQVAKHVSLSAGSESQSWPCDFPFETPPGLLLGLSGIGMFFLRRARPEAPSPLLPWSSMICSENQRTR